MRYTEGSLIGLNGRDVYQIINGIPQHIRDPGAVPDWSAVQWVDEPFAPSAGSPEAFDFNQVNPGLIGDIMGLLNAPGGGATGHPYDGINDPATGQPQYPGFGGGDIPAGSGADDFFSGMSMDLPQYNGPMAAPITEGMFSALQGIKNTANANPVGQSADLASAISAMLGGDGFAAGGKDPNQVMSQFRPNTNFTQMLGAAGKQPNVKFNPSDLFSVNNSVNKVSADAPDVNFSRTNNVLNTIQGGTPTTDTSRSDSLINDIISGRANDNVDPRMRGFQDRLLASHNTALEAPRFDNTQLFNDLKTVFESDLDNQTAELQEQFSGLGLGVGASDRLNRIASNAGEARAKFGVGIGQLARESFESAENRRLGAIGAAGGTADILNAGNAQAASMLQAVMNNERLPLQERMAIRDQILSTLPVELQRSLVPAELEMQRRGQIASTLPTQMAAATQPFAEQMDFLNTVTNPAAARQLAAAQTGVQLDENAMQRYMQERQMAERAREAAISAGVATRGQDIEQRGQTAQMANNLFNAESVLRGAADDEALRAYQEFVRTQGGGLQQMLAFLNSLPEGTVGVGPSTASQVGAVAGQIPWGAVWDGVKWVWGQATK